MILTRNEFRQRLEDGILILDGAKGTLLQPHLKPGACTDAATIEKPGLVEAIYAAYAKAGAHIISTNTFGSNRVKLGEFGLAERAGEINREAVRLAKRAVPPDVLVAGCIGPTGKLISPLGPLSFDEAFDAFRQQTLALCEGGADLLLLETFADLKELKAALMAARSVSELPVMAAMTYEEGFTTFTGTDPVTAACVMMALGADAVGVNCSTGPEPMLEIVGRYGSMGDCPIFVEPNAGMPRIGRKGTEYSVLPDEMARFGRKFVEIGANVVGSCCGSTPEYTAVLKAALERMKPVARPANRILRLSSRTRTVEIGEGRPFCVIGERLNPTNREDLTREIDLGHVALIQREAAEQEKQGARILDVNIGVPGTDEAAMMEKAVLAIENTAGCPLSIDSVKPESIEAALKASAGKALINSVNGEEGSLSRILPLARRYGAALLCLPVDEKGVPKTAEERIAVLTRIVERAEKEGIGRENLLCDCLTLTVSAEQKRADETLKALRIVKDTLKLPTVLGVSNISYGLPERSLVNATFLSMAMASGLDAAIMNPGDPRMMETVQAASVLTVRDRDSREFVKSHARKKKEEKREEQLFFGDEWKIPEAVLAGNREEIGGLIEKALLSGRTPQDINRQLLIPAIQEVGRKYDRKEIYLPQMIMSAETMQEAFRVLEPHFSVEEERYKGNVLLCTVKGDVHDIGKNIVGLFLKNHGFRVTDLGKDVPAEVIVEKTLALNADVVGLSALMTTTMVQMPRVIGALHAAGCRARVIVGGAVVTQKYAEEIGADAYARDAVSGVEAVKALVQPGK